MTFQRILLVCPRFCRHRSDRRDLENAYKNANKRTRIPPRQTYGKMPLLPTRPYYTLLYLLLTLFEYRFSKYKMYSFFYKLETNNFNSQDPRIHTHRRFNKIVLFCLRPPLSSIYIHK